MNYIYKIVKVFFVLLITSNVNGIIYYDVNQRLKDGIHEITKEHIEDLKEFSMFISKTNGVYRKTYNHTQELINKDYLSECANSLVYVYQHNNRRVRKLIIIKRESIIFYTSYAYFPNNGDFIFATPEDAVRFYNLMSYGVENAENNEKLQVLQHSVHPSGIEIGWNIQKINISPLISYAMYAYFAFQSKQAVEYDATDVEHMATALPEEYSVALKEGICEVYIDGKYAFSMLQKKIDCNRGIDYGIMASLSDYISYLSDFQSPESVCLEQVVYLVRNIIMRYFVFN